MQGLTPFPLNEYSFFLRRREAACRRLPLQDTEGKRGKQEIGNLGAGREQEVDVDCILAALSGTLSVREAGGQRPTGASRSTFQSLIKA